MHGGARISALRRSVDPRVLDALGAVGLLALMVLELTLKTEPAAAATTALAYLLAAGITLPFAIHRPYPMVALGIFTASLLAYGLGHFGAFPGYAAFALVVGIALHGDRRHAATAFGVCLAALAVAIALQPGTLATSSTWVSTGLALTVAWLAGLNIRGRRARWAALEERARSLEREREDRARQAVTEERLRIARELHDVVAHSMSVIAVQSGVAHHVIDTRPELARQALETVGTTSRAALVEMRRLLGVLRRGDEPNASLAPAPGLDDVPSLVPQLAEAGLRVDVTVPGERPELPAAVDLSAFRIVQEGLTNVLRHGGPSARVSIDYPVGAVVVEVRDDGRLPGTPAAVPVSGLVASGGHGLIGMRERVAVFGGELEAGPCRDGGFKVRATLPIEQPCRTTALPPSPVREHA